jgi:23S rRNA (guanosine2251-2'-O)-methyltransferase
MPRDRSPHRRESKASSGQRRARTERQTFVISGRRVVLEAIAAGGAVEILAPSTASDPEILRAAERAGVRVRIGPAGTDREIAARVTLPPPLSERDLSTHRFGAEALVVVLDGITDPQNLGAAARSAESAGAELLVTRDRRAAPTTPAAVRASAGALVHLPLARVANIPRALERLRDGGFTIVGLDGDAPRSIYDEAGPEGRVALVVGAEDRGLSRLVRDRCDELRSLPMLGRVSSLNASAALAAAIYGFVLPSRPPRSGR